MAVVPNSREMWETEFQYKFFQHCSRMNAAKEIWSGFPLHWHPEYEILFSISGNIDVNINGEIYKLTDGAAIFVNSKFLYSSASILVNDDKFWSIVFSENFLFPSVTDPLYNKYVVPLHNIGNNQNVKMFPVIIDKSENWKKELLDNMNNLYKIWKSINDSKENDEGFDLKVRSALLSMFYEFIKHDAFISVKAIQNHKHEVIRHVLRFMQDNYKSDIKIHKLAKELNSSPEYFCRYFKTLVGMSPKKYLLDLRLQEVKKQLQTNDNSITNIAYDCGFSDINYFSRLFKKKYRIAPNKYRTYYIQ